MSQKNDEKFLEPRTLTAIVLMAVLFFGWQAWLKHKYPALNNPKVATETKKDAPPTTVEAVTPPAESPSTVKPVVTATGPEKTTIVDEPTFSFKISSHGMGVKDFTLKNRFDREKKPMTLGVGSPTGLFSVGVVGENGPLVFDISQQDDKTYLGTAHWNGIKILRRITVDLENGALKNEITVENPTAEFKGLTLSIAEHKMDIAAGHFLLPNYEHQEFVVQHNGTIERINSTAAKDKLNKTFSDISMTAVGSQYFTTAVIDHSEVSPEVSLTGGKDADLLQAQLAYKPLSLKKNMQFQFIAYAGPKSYSQMKAIDAELPGTIDFGFFTSIAKILLFILQWLHSYVGNWGVAIIIMTLLVRMLVLPLNMSTFKSSRKMQKLQPMVKALKERYKDDSQTLNQEMMKLWKENGVNPVGGCLPMILQLPIFFAYYRVLGQSIELYQAPFMFWIHDLSLKDPYYVLPVLMGVAMWFQQKMSPTAVDPSQAKIMQFLPIVFAFMMISLPSGLTLYIFVNTITGVLTQKLIVNDRSNTVAAKEVKA
jgi:YidC/Oxa1 family membrane protein insertase